MTCHGLGPLFYSDTHSTYFMNSATNWINVNHEVSAVFINKYKIDFTKTSTNN